MSKHPDEIVKEIAKAYLDVESLEPQGSDRLDFKELAVWSIKDALDAAFLAGFKMGEAGR